MIEKFKIDSWFVGKAAEYGSEIRDNTEAILGEELDGIVHNYWRGDFCRNGKWLLCCLYYQRLFSSFRNALYGLPAKNKRIKGLYGTTMEFCGRNVRYF